MSPVFAKQSFAFSMVSSVRRGAILHTGRERYRPSAKSDSLSLSTSHANPILFHHCPRHMLIPHYSRCLLVAQLLLKTGKTLEDTQARERMSGREKLITC